MIQSNPDRQNQVPPYIYSGLLSHFITHVTIGIYFNANFNGNSVNA